jgi:hypothetical protein
MIEALFKQMDTWRHFPNYQLERRVDSFFALYLPEILESHFNFSVQNEIIPEFPILVDGSPNHRSFKIDFVAVSVDGSKALLIELKTDMKSRREGQDKYLKKAQGVKFIKLLKDIVKIFKASKSKQKYYHLLCQLTRMGQLDIPDEVTEIMAQERLNGIYGAVDKIKFPSHVNEISVVYIQPQSQSDDDHVISLETVRSVVQKHNDPFSLRFAKSLENWAGTEAGEILEENIKCL